MKVRHKTGNPDLDYEVVGGSDTHYYALVGGPNMYALPKVDYVPAPPTEQWEDCTAECSQNGFGYIHHGHNHVFGSEAEGKYRLRKVQVYPYQQPTEIKCWAFIVERKVS